MAGDIVTWVEIEKATAEFFRLHWPNEWKNKKPEWTKPWKFDAKPEEWNAPGCFLLMGERDVVRCVASSQGSLRDRIFGLHRSQRGGKFAPAKGMAWLRGVSVISFSPDSAYLAPALERFLLAKFSGLSNVVGRR